MLDLRYVAGLFDGEGYIGIRRWTRKDTPCVSYVLFGGINMTYRPIVEELHRQFGGGFYINRHDLRKATHRAVYHWAVGNQICARFLRQIVPYTIVKGEEIAIALELQASIDLWKFKLGNHSRFHPERDRVLADRERLCLKISELKHLTFPTA